jgi:hypothetical protein
MAIDFSRYVNLTPFDASPTSIYLDAIEYGRVALPEFQMRQGTPEDALLQAVSYISSLNVSAINRLPDRLMAGLLGMMGVEVNDGDQAVIDVEFTAMDYDGTAIPETTLLRYDYEVLGDQFSIYFQTTEEGIIDPVVYTGTESLPTVVVEARCLEVGRILPVGAGLELMIESPTSNILSATIDSVISFGTNPETTLEYLNRASNYLASLSSAFGKASQIDGYVFSTFSDTISAVKTYDLTNHEGDLLWADAAEQGYVTVFVYGKNAYSSTDEKNDILISIQDRTIAGLEVGVIDVNIVDIMVDVSAIYSSEYDVDKVEYNIQSVIATNFSPNGYKFSEKIRRSEFIAVVSSVPGVMYVEDVTLTCGAGGTIVDGNVEFTQKGSLPLTAVADIVVTLTSMEP